MAQIALDGPRIDTVIRQLVAAAIETAAAHFFDHSINHDLP
jgi:hypothetical protein